MHDGDTVRFPVNSRIMIDAAFFQKVNPNYSRLRITERAGLKINAAIDGYFTFSQSGSDLDDPIQSYGKGLEEMTEDDLLICCPTVLGFSLNDKRWGEILLSIY